jgi:membrane fusion protein, multidrug efflux system
MKRTLLFSARISRFIALAAFLGIGCLAAGCGSRNQAGEGAERPVLEVAVVTVQPERVVITTELPGRTAPFLIAEIRPQVNGLILKREFQEGSMVKAGDILYQIDPAQYQAAYNQAKAAVAMAEAQLPAVRSRAERFKKLVVSHAVGQQDFDDTQAAFQQLKAQIDVNKAAMEQAKIHLSYTPIRAPISGRIGRSSVSVGALVTAYQPVPLATIQQLDPIYVDVTRSTAELLQLQQCLADGRLVQSGVGQSRLQLRMEDGSPYPQEGALQFQDVSVDPSTGSVLLRSIFPNPETRLLPGLFVRVVMPEGIQDQALLIPQESVGRNPKGEPFALVVDAEEKVQTRILTIDRALGSRWLVSSGLNSGDRVIVEGGQKVRPGTPVQAVPFGTDSQPAVSPVPPSADIP